MLANVDGQKTLQQKWVVEGGQTAAWVKANIVPNLFARFEGLGWTSPEIMAFNLLPAYWNDAVLSGQGGGQPITGRITSNNGVTVPAGNYLANFPCIMDGGDYRGAGTGFPGNAGSATVSMNTTITLNRSGWIGGVRVDGTYVPTGGSTTNITFDSMNCLQSTTWQMLSGSNSYTESGSVDGFRLTGDQTSWYDPAYTSHGLATWDIGEGWIIGRIFAENFNGYGWACVRGTPVTSNSCISTFQNALGGIGLIGTELNTGTFVVASADDNPAQFVMISGYGRNAGGVFTMCVQKSESGKRTPNKSQILLWQRTPCYGLINIVNSQCAMSNGFLDAMIVVNNNTTSGGQIIHAQLRGWNCRTILHDVTSGLRWPAVEYRPERVTYSYRNGVARLQDDCTGLALPSSSVVATDRLGMVPVNGVFDYTTGTPIYDIYGGGTPPPPPPACVWVTGAWSAWSVCTGGTQTRTRSVTSSVVGCTPTDPMPPNSETQACGQPPPPVTPLYSLNNFNNTNPSNTIDIPDVAGVKRIVLTNVSFTVTSFAYQRLVVEAGGTIGLRAVPQNTQGTICRFRMPTGAYATSNIANITIGTLYPTLELTLPTTMTVGALLAVPGTGSAMLLQCSNISFYAQ